VNNPVGFMTAYKDMEVFHDDDFLYRE
ncbi:hypothetical protein EVA_02207, partial [gut metagenome]